jgi:hypothetical protein
MSVNPIGPNAAQNIQGSAFLNAANVRQIGDKFANRIDANIKLLGGKRTGDELSAMAQARMAAWKASHLEHHYRGK